MLNKFQWCKFSECDISDAFFDSLKEDYEEFPKWFQKKSLDGSEAFVYATNKKIKAFVYLKEESENIILESCELPSEKRIKIGTLKISDETQGQRLGEGAIGVALWYWQNSNANQIYLTVFSKHIRLIRMLETFGFTLAGLNLRGENIYIKDKRLLQYKTPYTSFPFINPAIDRCGYIPIIDTFHDTLFPYSELYNTRQETEEIAAANGITKVFIATPSSRLDYVMGEPVLIYRRHTGNGQATYKSVITSFCSIVKHVDIKLNNREYLSLAEFKKLTGNKTVYNEIQIDKIYNNHNNIVVLEMLYNGYFGKGKNITHHILKEKGLFEGYPYTNKLSQEQFKNVLEMGGKIVQNIIID